MRRAAMRKREQVVPLQVHEAGLHLGPTLPYNPISPQSADRIIQAAFELLAEVGVRFEPGTEADGLLLQAGCTLGPEGVVRMPEPVVRRALASVAKSVKLWNRDGTAAIDIDDRHTWFMPGMTCIKLQDIDSGEARDSTRDDLALVTRIATLAGQDGEGRDRDHMTALCRRLGQSDRRPRPPLGVGWPCTTAGSSWIRRTCRSTARRWPSTSW